MRSILRARTGRGAPAVPADMVRFRRDVRLDPSQVEDVRGRGPMLGLPAGGLTVGGGGLGLVGGLSGPLGNLDGSTVSQAPPGRVLREECRSEVDANTKEDCRIVGDVNSIQRYWDTAFAAANRDYVPAKTVFFTGSV